MARVCSSSAFEKNRKRYLPASAACLIAAMPLPDPSNKSPDDARARLFAEPTPLPSVDAVLLPQPVKATAKRLPATSPKPTRSPRIERLTGWSSCCAIFAKAYI